MDLNIKLISNPERLSTNTLTALISNFTKTIEQSVFESICSLNRSTSRRLISKGVYGNIHIDVDRVEKGSFVLFLTGALAGTIASCFYSAIKRHVKHRVTSDEVTNVVNRHIPTIAKNLENDIKGKRRFGSLYVNNIDITLDKDRAFQRMSITIELGMPEKEHMPATSEEQIEYMVRILRDKAKGKIKK